MPKKQKGEMNPLFNLKLSDKKFLNPSKIIAKSLGYLCFIKKP